jgi:MFS family permease
MRRADDRSSELARGWPIIVIAAVGIACGSSPLPFFTIGVFAKAWSAEFGWSRAEVSGFMTSFTYGGVIGAPLAGMLLDRWGVRRVALVSLACLAIGLAAIGFLTRGLYSFYALAFCSAIFASGTLPTTWSRAVLSRFQVRRGFALGLALAGTGISAALLPTYATWLLSRFDWRVAYLGLAALPGLVALPLCYLLLPPPRNVTRAAASLAAASPQTGYSLRSVAAHYRFWVIAVSFVIVSIGVGGMALHLVPMLTDHGYSPSQAAAIASAQGLAVIAGRVLTGYLLDRVWAPGITAIVFICPAAACLAFAGNIGGPVVASTGAAIMGFAAGAEIDLLAYLVGRYFGMRHFGGVYGALYAIYIVGAGTGPLIFGWAYDVTGSYVFILQIAAGCFLGGAALILSLGAYPRTLPAAVTAP